NPQDTNWLETVNEPATEAIREARKDLTFSKKQTNHRHADCPAVAFGVSFGGGPQEPGNLKQTNAAAFGIMSALLSLNCFCTDIWLCQLPFHGLRISCYIYCTANLDKLFEWNPNLRRLFRNNAWAACTINFGPQSITFPQSTLQTFALAGAPSQPWASLTTRGEGILYSGTLGFTSGSRQAQPSLSLQLSLCTPMSPLLLARSVTPLFNISAGLFRWVENGFRS
ncbi:hypothetical protein BDP27DRAFT_1479894, partial [Rhodocollybia butyracea]